jgi:predicted transcriptional regulator
MRTKCERAVADIFPVARALIARKLVEVYGISQTAAARKMGLTQPAVSQYVKEIRGKGAGGLSEDSQFVSVAEGLAKGLAEGSITPASLGGEMCAFCRLAEGGRDENYLKR